MKQQKEASYNARKSRLILLLLPVFSSTIGFLLGKLFDAGFTGAAIGLCLGLVYCCIVYLFSTRILLTSLKAKPIVLEQNAHLYNRVWELAGIMGVTKPTLYYIDDSAMNILSVGRNQSDAKIVVTKGLIEKLTTAEIEAVIAHELAHIKNGDITIGEYAALVVGFFPFVSETLKRRSDLFLPFAVLFSLFSPLSGLLLQTVLSPKRELEADVSGVLVTRFPDGLAQALEKLTNDPYSVRTALHATAHLFIINPFHGKVNRSASSLFMTHPPTEERINILKEM